MCTDEAVVQFPSSTLSLSHPMAGLWVLLCSSQLFRPLSHPHMQDTNYYTCVFLICRYTDGGFHSYKKLYLCFIGLCFRCVGGGDDKGALPGCQNVRTVPPALQVCFAAHLVLNSCRLSLEVGLV
jgi:hypothetical protein